MDLPYSIESINDALKNCEGEIKKVEEYVHNFKGVLDARSQVHKKWASLKHVRKKREIKRLQDKLESARNHLQMALGINANRLM